MSCFVFIELLMVHLGIRSDRVVFVERNLLFALWRDGA